MDKEAHQIPIDKNTVLSVYGKQKLVVNGSYYDLVVHQAFPSKERMMKMCKSNM